MGNFGSSWATMAIFTGSFGIRVSKYLGNSDGQLWRSLGNNRWATMKPHGQLWEFLGNKGDFHGLFRNSIKSSAAREPPDLAQQTTHPNGKQRTATADPVASNQRQGQPY